MAVMRRCARRGAMSLFREVLAEIDQTNTYKGASNADA